MKLVSIVHEGPYRRRGSRSAFDARGLAARDAVRPDAVTKHEAVPA